MANPQTVPKKTAPTSTTGPRVVSAPRMPDKTARERREEGLAGWLQLGATLAFNVPRLRPDAAVIAYYGPGMAEEAAAIAEEDARAAALLDKIASMGPYSRLVTLVVAAGMQIAANHGLVKPGVMGTMKPDEFIDAVTRTDEGGDEDDKPTDRIGPKTRG